MGVNSISPLSGAAREELEHYMARSPRIGAVPVFPSPTDPNAPIRKDTAGIWLRKAEKLAGVGPLLKRFSGSTRSLRLREFWQRSSASVRGARVVFLLPFSGTVWAHRPKLASQDKSTAAVSGCGALCSKASPAGIEPATYCLGGKFKWVLNSDKKPHKPLAGCTICRCSPDPMSESAVLNRHKYRPNRHKSPTQSSTLLRPASLRRPLPPRHPSFALGGCDSGASVRSKFQRRLFKCSPPTP